MKTLHRIAALAVILPALTAAVAAQEALPEICAPAATDHGGHGGHDMGAAEPEAAPAPEAMDEAHAALAAGMDAMHRDMSAGLLAEDIDVAFACGMIPHHQGAIDMAKAVLEYGDDPWIRSLAEAIIAAQEKEIAEMRDWLAQQPR